MAGNVLEWTRCLWEGASVRPEFKYPYDPTDGRENLDATTGAIRVWRGGAFGSDLRVVRCAYRYGDLPLDRDRYIGVRVVVRPCF
jgi:formylglycine-generating enzyme required for sulfatase activity